MLSCKEMSNNFLFNTSIMNNDNETAISRGILNLSVISMLFLDLPAKVPYTSMVLASYISYESSGWNSWIFFSVMFNGERTRMCCKGGREPGK